MVEMWYFPHGCLAVPEAWALTAAVIIHNEKCTLAGVDVEEVHIDNFLHSIRGKLASCQWLEMGSAAEMADLICLSWEALSICCVTCCDWLMFKCFSLKRRAQAVSLGL